VRHLLLFVHDLGFVLWMGGSFAAMGTGMLMQQLARNELGGAMAVQGRLLRGMTLPGVVMVVLSGLLMTLRLYGAASAVSGFPMSLMLMQAAGLLAAGITLVVTVPTLTRLLRLDPVGPHAALFDALRRRMRMTEIIAGALAVVALIGGVLLR